MSHSSLTGAFISSLEIKIDGVEDLQLNQEQNLELFQKQNADLDTLKTELEDISLIFSKLPEYLDKAETLKRDMNFVSKKGVELRERAKEVERLKQQRKLADERLLAQPSNAIGNKKESKETQEEGS
jgi:hypothetical protein